MLCIFILELPQTSDIDINDNETLTINDDTSLKVAIDIDKLFIEW